MSYSLESEKEAERLEEQSRLPLFDPSCQLENFKVSNGSRILDAGCGSGLIGRFLKEKFKDQVIVEGCDISEVRVEQAKEINKDYSIRFFQSTLENLSAPECKYDKVISRYVFQHLENPLKVSSELLRVLKPGGQVYLIDSDGVLFNVASKNSELNEYLELLKKNFKFDLFIGRKLPQILLEAGFSNIEWDIKAISFQGENLRQECEQYRQRLQAAKDHVLQPILGNNTNKFIELYLSELMVPGSVHFTNQFIVTGHKE